MKNPLYITRKYQIGYMIGREGIAIALCALFQIFGLLGFFQFDFMRIILGVTFTALHFYILCSGANTLAKGDAKSYTPLGYNLKWGALWGVMISAATLVFVVVYLLNWKFFSVDGAMTNGVSIVINFLFYILESPYLAFLFGVENTGTLPWYIVAVMLILPTVATVLGYFLANNEESVLEKIRGIMFEKSENEE